MPRVTKSAQRQLTSAEVLIQDFLRVNYSGRSYVTIKPETHEVSITISR